MSVEPKVYYLDPALRRSAVYAMIGFILLAAVAFVIGQFVLKPDALKTSLICTVFGSIGLGMVLPLRWALRIDDGGLARRRLFGWDSWSWGDFASGRIEKRYPLSFVDRGRPWWRRKLSIHHLAAAECKSVIGYINDHYRFLEPEEPCHGLQIKYGFRRHAECDSNGIFLTVRGSSFRYSWNEVARVYITRMDPLRRDFVCLTIGLPDRQIELKIVHGQHGGTSLSWSGASPEQVNNFLFTHVSAARIDVDIADERPRRRIDVVKQLSLARQRERQIGWILWFFGPLLTCCLVWTAISSGVWKAIFLAGMYGGAFAPMIWILRRDLRRKTKKLESWLTESDSNESRPVRTEQIPRATLGRGDAPQS